MALYAACEHTQLTTLLCVCLCLRACASFRFSIATLILNSAAQAEQHHEPSRCPSSARQPLENARQDELKEWN